MLNDMAVSRLPVILGHVPFGSAEATNPEAFHMQDRSRVNDELAVVALGDWTQFMAEQDGRRLFHCSVERKNRLKPN